MVVIILYALLLTETNEPRFFEIDINELSLFDEDQVID